MPYIIESPATKAMYPCYATISSSITLPSVLDAQSAPTPLDLSPPQTPDLDNAPLIYGFPAHWFGVSSPTEETSSAGEKTSTLPSSPAMSSSSSSSSSTRTISSPEPTFFGIDASWMSCGQSSWSSHLPGSPASSWLDDSRSRGILDVLQGQGYKRF